MRVILRRCDREKFELAKSMKLFCYAIIFRL
ncbi:unnamed protein product [Linum tenue]|uniref:Ribosomal protein S16 n=1 Tax=Linum tenue TaxID=586396 RepID=A0AAV0MEB1_9ROSI|nr:unnamed protein product [Linum tenue]